MSSIRQKVKFDKKLLDQDALKILKKLNKSDHETYLVGGCIRDILLGHKPKDFDIATSATPEQIHKLFKRSRIIGRRFKLVHIMFSARKFIEVATFRAGKVQTSNDGLVLRDNYYGTLEDDVFRRDFTVNGLYYDLVNFQVIDYVGGLDENRGISTIINAVNKTDVRLNLAGVYDPESYKLDLGKLNGWKNVIEYGFVGPTEVREILSVDRSVTSSINLSFPNDNNIKPKKGNFEIVNYVLMSNDIGERWSVITLTNLSTGNRNLEHGHLIALFADGSRTSPLEYKLYFKGKT